MASRQRGPHGDFFLAHLARLQRNFQTLRPADYVQRELGAHGPPAQMTVKGVDSIHRRFVHANDEVSGT
jgi:hypothetical protein